MTADNQEDIQGRIHVLQQEENVLTKQVSVAGGIALGSLLTEYAVWNFGTAIAHTLTNKPQISPVAAVGLLTIFGASVATGIVSSVVGLRKSLQLLKRQDQIDQLRLQKQPMFKQHT